MLLLVSCGGGSGSNSSSTISSTLNNGVAQKGPFLIGSTVVISVLNTSGISTGEVFESKTSSKDGKFSYDLGETASNTYYRIQVTGHFFNENSGSTSENPITLTAITSNPENSSINVLTHWLSQRTEVLLAKGKTLIASLKQSQKELTKLFNIKNANTLDITSNSNQMVEDNAMLLLLSGALMEASDKYKTSSQTVIDEIGVDFADDGLISEKGDEWFIRLQALIRDNPKSHTKKYVKEIREKLGFDVALDHKLPALIPLASRPAANVPPLLLAAPSETITLDGSESHDSGDIINFTWFRVDQQTQYDIQVSDRFTASPSITAPNEATVLAAPNEEIILLYALVVTDADKLSHTGVVKVIIRIPPPENNAPVAESQIDDQSVITNEDTPVNITLKGSDPDGDLINFVISTPLSLPNGLLEGTAPNLVYTPTANFHGTDHFTFLVDDGLITSEIARVNIIVLPINDPPTADDKTIVTDEDTPVTINFTGSDIENDSLTFRIGSNTPNNGSLRGIPPIVLYTPGRNFFGNDSFEYIANDGVDDSEPATVNITVNPVNDPPEAIPQNVFTDEDTAISITLTGRDEIENDPLIFNLGDVSVRNGSLTGVPPNMTYLPNLDFNGNDSFNFTVSDGSDNSPAALVEIQVFPVDDNTPPDANAGDNDEVFLIREENSGGVSETTSITLNGSGSSDAEDLKSELAYSWKLLSGPTAAIITPPFPASAIVDAPTFTVTIANPEPNVEDIRGDYTFQLTVTDTGGKFDQDVVVITVSDTPNLAPVADARFSGDVPIYNEGTPNVVLLGSGSTDSDGTIDTYLWEQTDGPTVTIRNSDSINPVFDAPEVSTAPLTLTFKLTVIDDDGAPDSDEITVTINGRPTAIPQDATLDEVAFPFSPNVDIILSGTDPEGSSLTYKLTSEPSEGFIEGINEGDEFTDSSISYVSFYDPLRDSFTFTVFDEHGFESGPATVNIIVDNNTAPIADSRTGDVQVILNLDPSTGSGSVTFNLSGSDPDGDEFTFELVEANPPSGTNFTLGPNFIDDGEVTYTVLDYRGAFEFKFKVRDQHGLPSADATVRIITIPFN